MGIPLVPYKYKGPFAKIISTLAPKDLYRDQVKAKVYTVWAHGLLGVCRHLQALLGGLAVGLDHTHGIQPKTKIGDGGQDSRQRRIARGTWRRGCVAGTLALNPKPLNP